MKLKANQYYKGLNENYNDIQTNLTHYEKGKVISISIFQLPKVELGYALLGLENMFFVVGWFISGITFLTPFREDYEIEVKS